MRCSAAAAVVAVALALSACGDDDSSSSSAPDTSGAAASIGKMAIAAPEKANDYGWNQQGVESATRAADTAGAEIEVADGIGYENVEPVLRRLAQSGSELTIAQASGYNTIAPKVATQFNVPHDRLRRPQCEPSPASWRTSRHRASRAPTSRASWPPRRRRRAPSASSSPPPTPTGTRWPAASSRAHAASTRTSSSASPRSARRPTPTPPAASASPTQVIAAGADVVFGMGDGSSFGMLQAVETAKPPAGASKVYFIDVIGDKTNVDKEGVLLSSVIWDFTDIYNQAIADIGGRHLRRRRATS